MADITKIVAFSKEAKKLIKDKTQSSFNYTDWGGDDLLSLRKEIRDFYRNQQKGVCAYCKNPVSLTYASNCHIEHIVPKSRHPNFIFNPKNLCVVCSDCNQIKGEKETLVKPTGYKTYPRSKGAFKIIHPHFDNYDEHIIIINGYYIDKGSKKGNFTIGICNLNKKLAVFGWESEITNEEELIIDMNNYIEEKDVMKRMKKLYELKEKLFN